MSIQDIFYLFGTIYMLLGILLTIAIMVVLFYVVRVISKTKQKVDEKIESIKSITSHPSVIAKSMGSIIAETLKFGISNIFNKV